MGFKTAKLEVESGDDIEILFNPAEYNLSDSATYTDKVIPGLDGPITQYISGASTSLTMTLMFDTYCAPTISNPTESGTDVSKKTKEITELTKIKGDLHRPPIVTFSWGPLNFKGVIIDVKQTFTMFLSDGKPVRAKVEVTFKSVLDPDTAKRNSPFESPDRTKFRTIKEKQQLWQYAYEEYGNVNKWRVIAKANQIINPLDVKKGEILKLPAL